MKPAPFRYVAPGSLEEAVSVLGRYGDEAKVIAGGQSLVPMMAFRLATPAVLVDLNGVTDLEYVRRDGDELVVGALARHRSIQDLGWLRERCALVADGVELIGHPAIRNRGTVGGSLAHADPSAEWPAILAALDGEVTAVGPNGTRSIAASDLFETYFTTTLAPDEILAEARFPLGAGPAAGSCFLEVARRHGDFALAGVAAMVNLTDDPRLTGARIALIGVRDRPVRAHAAEALLDGAEPTDAVFAEAADTVADDIDPISDLHGSADYRRHVATELVRRALRTATDRARAA
jgi:aerobic carbon-monoxide dehydrogenase medium subunit